MPLQTPPIQVLVTRAEAAIVPILGVRRVLAELAVNRRVAPLERPVARVALEIATQEIGGDLAPDNLACRDSLDGSPFVADGAFVVQIEASVVGQFLDERSIPCGNRGLNGKAKEQRSFRCGFGRFQKQVPMVSA